MTPNNGFQTWRIPSAFIFDSLVRSHVWESYFRAMLKAIGSPFLDGFWLYLLVIVWGGGMDGYILS